MPGSMQIAILAVYPGNVGRKVEAQNEDGHILCPIQFSDAGTSVSTTGRKPEFQKQGPI